MPDPRHTSRDPERGAAPPSRLGPYETAYEVHRGYEQGVAAPEPRETPVVSLTAWARRREER